MNLDLNVNSVHFRDVRPQPAVSAKTVTQNSQELSKSISLFCYDWFRIAYKTKSAEENICISPASAVFALLMAYVGASGKTKDEMAKALHLTSNIDNLAKMLFPLSQSLTHDDTLKIANTLFVMSGFDLTPQYAQRSQEMFQATPNFVDFNESGKSASTINKWVEDQTNSRIKDLVKPSMLNGDTRAVLVNAIYMLATWKFEFKKDQTEENTPFFVNKGIKVLVPMMKQTADFEVGKNDQCQFIVLPYEEKKEDTRRLEMMIFLPKKSVDLDKFLPSLNHDYVESCRNSVRPREVDLSLPRFELNDEQNLNSALMNLGMQKAFGKGAEFDIVNDSIYISDVVQKTFMKVDEKGTEAAAATAVLMMTECAGPEPIKFEVNRPFVSLVRDAETGTVLFISGVKKPGSSESPSEANQEKPTLFDKLKGVLTKK